MNYQLDARRLLCPLPVIRTQDKIASLQAGDVLEISCTDPGVKSDIPVWCRMNGHSVKGIDTVQGVITITIEVEGLSIEK